MKRPKAAGKAKSAKRPRKARKAATPAPEPKDETISVRAFALLVGKSHTLIQKAIAKGRLTAGLTKDAKGRTRVEDVKAATAQWEETVAAGKAKAAEDSSGSLWDAQRRVAIETAKKLRMANRKERGSLVVASVVQREQFEVARIVRDNIMNVPARVAAQLASETDAGRVQTLLETELRAALTKIADLLDEAAA